MIKFLKYLGLGTSGLVLAAVAYFAWRLHDLEARACGNQILGTYPSPGGSKKAVLFVRNCGATTDWFLEASIIALAEELHDTDKGNIFAADSDHGAAAEYNPIGGPAVKVTWADSDELEIRYSQGSRIFLKISQFGQTRISYSSF
jgi:hypothetical protein